MALRGQRAYRGRTIEGALDQRARKRVQPSAMPTGILEPGR
jgi:hypothetical protein